MFDGYNEVLSIEEAAKALNVGKTTLYALLRDNKIAGFRIGLKWRIPKASIIKFMDEAMVQKVN